MKIENQVCTLEQAKRLKELGVEQMSLFYYTNSNEHQPIWDRNHLITKRIIHENCSILYSPENPPKTFSEIIGVKPKRIREYYTAFTVAELGVMLPATCYINNHYCSLQCVRSGGDNEFFMTMYQTIAYHGDASIKVQFAKQTEAQARAAMLIYLLENNLITADEVNKRLNEA